jgi:hypothetical protein
MSDPLDDEETQDEGGWDSRPGLDCGPVAMDFALGTLWRFVEEIWRPGGWTRSCGGLGRRPCVWASTSRAFLYGRCLKLTLPWWRRRAKDEQFSPSRSWK